MRTCDQIYRVNTYQVLYICCHIKISYHTQYNSLLSGGMNSLYNYFVAVYTKYLKFTESKHLEFHR